MSRSPRGGSLNSVNRLTLVFLLTACAWGQSAAVTFLPQNLIESGLRAYTAKNTAREAALKTLFHDAGCKDLSEQPVFGAKAPNLICTLKGTTDAIIVVGAHFDLIADNWTGAAVLPSLFQGLAASPRKHTFVFVAFTGEEPGLLGAQYYVNHLGAGQSRVQGMVNLDTLGLGETLVWRSHSDWALSSYFTATAQQLNIPLAAADVENVGVTDADPFRQRKIPSVTIHSVVQKTPGMSHSPANQTEDARLDYYYETYRLLTAYLAAIDLKLGQWVPPAK